MHLNSSSAHIPSLFSSRYSLIHSDATPSWKSYAKFIISKYFNMNKNLLLLGHVQYFFTKTTELFLFAVQRFSANLFWDRIDEYQVGFFSQQNEMVRSHYFYPWVCGLNSSPISLLKVFVG